MRVGILIYDGVDLLDAGGPYEVFLTASRLRLREGASAPFEVVTFSPAGGAVTAYGGLRLVPHTSVDDAGPLDVAVVPGTIDLDTVLADAAVLDAVRALLPTGRLVASVCTGAFLLAETGALDGLTWTTHWEDIDALSERIGSDGAVRGVRWVDRGDVVTGGGLSSGIAMSLHLVDRLAGRDLAKKTARQLDYEWQPR